MPATIPYRIMAASSAGGSAIGSTAAISLAKPAISPEPAVGVPLITYLLLASGILKPSILSIAALGT